MVSPILIDIPEELRGSRVLLRSYLPEDASPLWEAIQESREHLAPWLPWVHKYHSLEDVRAYVLRARARWLLREDLTVGIFEPQTGPIPRGQRSASDELGTAHLRDRLLDPQER